MSASSHYSATSFNWRPSAIFLVAVLSAAATGWLSPSSTSTFSWALPREKFPAKIDYDGYWHKQEPSNETYNEEKEEILRPMGPPTTVYEQGFCSCKYPGFCRCVRKIPESNEGEQRGMVGVDFTYQPRGDFFERRQSATPANHAPEWVLELRFFPYIPRERDFNLMGSVIARNITPIADTLNNTLYGPFPGLDQTLIHGRVANVRGSGISANWANLHYLGEKKRVYGSASYLVSHSSGIETRWIPIGNFSMELPEL